MKTYPMMARIRAEGGVTRIDVMDDIGGGLFSDGITASSFAAQMAGRLGPLDVHISSAGGDVFDGIAIAEALRAHPGPVTTYVDGIAASIASVIAQAGQRRVMAPGSMMMLHDAWGFPEEPNEAGLLKMAATLGKVSDNLAAQYAARAGGTPEQWREVMRAETWYTADEAVAAGLADEVSGQAAQLPGGLDLEAVAASAPARIMAALRSLPQAADGGKKCKTCKGSGRLKHPGTGKNGMTCPGCKGSGVYDPDHDGDDDSTAAGDTDHDYIEPDGSPGPKAAAGRVLAAGKPYEPQPYHRDPDETVECPKCHLFNDTDAKFCDQCGTELVGRDDVRVLPAAPAKGAADGLTEERVRAILREEVARAAAAVPVLAAGAKVDDSPWDAAKAWAAGSASDDPEAFFRGICAGEKTTGKPDTQAHWALPYRYSPSAAPNAAAVRNCMARLSQTQDLKDPDGTKKKLEGLMKQVNPDYEPEDHVKSVFSQRLREMRSALPALKGAEA